jgi:hypothetical protein
MRQRDLANHLGMWAFIATEVLFFGGLFLAYFIYRITYPSAFAAGSHTLNFWRGTINTAVLLTSSLTMALGDAFIRRGNRAALRSCLISYSSPSRPPNTRRCTRSTSFPVCPSTPRLRRRCSSLFSSTSQ